MQNFLRESVVAYARLLEAEENLILAIGGPNALDEFNEALSQELGDLTVNTYTACSELSERATEARINLIWRDLLKKHQRTKQ